MPKHKILIVEDEAIVAEDIRQHIEEEGYQVVNTVDSGEKALAFLQNERVDLILMDIMLAGEIDGIDTASQVKKLYLIPIIFLTAYSDQKKLERARMAEPYGYLIKPFDERELKSTLTMALYKAEADAKVREGKLWTDTVLRSIESGVITVDTEGHVVYMNQYAENLVGHTLEQCADRHIDSVLQLKDYEMGASIGQAISQLVEAPDEITLDDEIPLIKPVGDTITDDDYQLVSMDDDINVGVGLDLNDEYQLVTDDGESRVLRTSFSQLRVNGETVDGIVIAFTDITYLKDIEAELRYMNAELVDVVSKRTEVLSGLNRELEIEKDEAMTISLLKGEYLSRVCSNAKPVCDSIIRTADAMMESGNLSDEQHKQVEKIASSMNTYLELANDIQDMAALDGE
ncbi:MAG: response regulator [Gammaproteobacteria bacterium]|nr:response regulator [Gammaproteobacteria bacterium]